jgi:hypothetical protein
MVCTRKNDRPLFCGHAGPSDADYWQQASIFRLCRPADGAKPENPVSFWGATGDSPTLWADLFMLQGRGSSGDGRLAADQTIISAAGKFRFR